MSYVDLTAKDGSVVATHTSDAEEITELRKRIEELEAECDSLAHQLNQCNERGGHIIAENKRLEHWFHGYRTPEESMAALAAKNKRLLDIQGLLISWMKRHKTDTSYPHKPTQQTYWEQIVSDYPYLAEVDDDA